MSLRVRIVGVVAVVVALVVVMLGVSLQHSTETSLLQEVDADLVARAELVARSPAFARFGSGAGGGPGRPLAGPADRVDPFGLAVRFDALARVLGADGAVAAVLDTEFVAPTEAAFLARADDGPVLSGGSAEAGRVRW
ncbi:MAG: hypothetical protein R2695_03175 [Acidimicrobiales bacterium]